MLLFNENHYSVIKRLVPFLEDGTLCKLYKKTVPRLDSHRCTALCFDCGKHDCPHEFSVSFADYKQDFENSTCYTLHKVKKSQNMSVCESYHKCTKCDVIVNMIRPRMDNRHCCGEFWCRNCRCLVGGDGEDHNCFVRRFDKLPLSMPPMIFADSETDFSTSVEDTHFQYSH